MRNRWVWLVALCIPMLLVMADARFRGTWGVMLWEEVILALVATLALAFLGAQVCATEGDHNPERSVPGPEQQKNNTRRIIGLVLVVLVWILAALDVNVFRHLTGAPVVVEFVLASLLTFGIFEFCSDEPA